MPPERIAQVPLEDRASSRLLHLHRSNGIVDHRRFIDCVEILRPGDLLVLNDTRVSAIRLFGHKKTGGKVEALLLCETRPFEYMALVKPGRSLRPGTRIVFENQLEAEVTEEYADGQKSLRFEPVGDFADRLTEVGHVPLPPYIHSALSDSERYQTVYSRSSGSAAAPTAGLHFTSEILDLLRANQVQIEHVTLHVGIDTFRPVQVENLEEHSMHGEECEVPERTSEAVSNCKGRVIAVGTTTVRTLESFAIGPRRVAAGKQRSSLFIRPGFQFQAIDGIFTNFHLPRTTMLAMISALAGREVIFRAYQEAIEQGYRFLSFGDSMLIL